MSIAGVSPAEKHVLLVLALRADQATAKCNPGIPRIAKDTGLSERHVHRAIVELERAKHITREIKPGIGTVYTVHPCHSGTPDMVSPLTSCRSTPDMVSTKLPRTTISQKTSSSSRRPARRRTPMPVAFVPVMNAETASVVDGWPPGRLAEQIEACRDWHLREGKLSADWQASWRTWVRNSKIWDTTNEQSRSAGRSQAVRGSTRDAIVAAFDRVDFG